MINQKRRRTDGAAAPQDGKPPAKTRRAEAAARRGPLRRDAHAGRRKSPHREGFPRAAAPIGRAAGAARRTGKTNVFCPPCDLSKKAHSPNPCAGAVLPAFCERRSAKETKPAPAASEAGSAPPNARGAKIRAGGPPDGPGSRTSAVTSGLRAGRLFYSNCKGRFSSLFFSILIMIVPNPPRTARRKRQEGRFFLEDHY